MIGPEEVEKIFSDCKNLAHVPVPYRDLVECIIDVDIREEFPEVADKWVAWMEDWIGYGYSEQEVVDIFYALMVSIYVDANMDCVLDDIKKYLENK